MHIPVAQRESLTSSSNYIILKSCGQLVTFNNLEIGSNRTQVELEATQFLWECSIVCLSSSQILILNK